MICRLPSGDALQTDTIERIIFGTMTTNEDEIRQSVADGRGFVLDMATGKQRLCIEPVNVLTCRICRAHEETTYVAEDAESIKAWVASIPLLGKERRI